MINTVQRRFCQSVKKLQKSKDLVHHLGEEFYLKTLIHSLDQEGAAKCSFNIKNSNVNIYGIEEHLND